MNIDQFINLIYFIVGLAIGLLQLYLGQRQFENQQKEKMDELRKSLADILQRVAVLQELNSQRSFDVQDKLIHLAYRDQALEKSGELAIETSDKIRELITQEISKGGGWQKKNLDNLEQKLDQMLSQLSAKVIDLSQPTNQTMQITSQKRSEDELTLVRIDHSNSTVWIGDRKIDNLPPNEFLIIKILYEHSNEVVTYDMLTDALDPDEKNTGEMAYRSGIIETIIARLRKRLEEDASSPKYIITIRGVGYMLRTRLKSPGYPLRSQPG